ncbi:hypothetical protein [Pseudonocardia terrae]|nr:hypothetical protein [Pseudonocardia terrae]
MTLETGTRQPGAIAPHRSSGSAPIAPFGVYRDEPGSLCFAEVIS